MDLKIDKNQTTMKTFNEKSNSEKLDDLIYILENIKTDFQNSQLNLDDIEVNHKSVVDTDELQIFNDKEITIRIKFK